MKCYKTTAGCGVYENRSCSECPYSKPPKPKCDTCSFSYSCNLKDTNLASGCGKYSEEHDKIKTEYCEKNKIPLIRINSLQYSSITINDLLLKGE